MLPAPVERIQRNHIGRETHVYQRHGHWLTGFPAFVNTSTQLLDHEMQHWLQARDGLLRKERTHGCATSAMQLVAHRPKDRVRQSELIDIVKVLVAGFVQRIELFIVIWFIDMELIGTDSDNGA